MAFSSFIDKSTFDLFNDRIASASTYLADVENIPIRKTSCVNTKSALCSTGSNCDGKKFGSIKMKQPMFSLLSSDQHKLYLQLFQRFTSGPPTSSQDHKQLATFKELHAMVLQEQAEYLKYLKQLALLNEADYMFIHPSLHFFFCVYNKMRLRAVSNYPPYYIMHDVLMLANNNSTNNCQFNRPTTIFETGRVSSYEEKQLERTIGWIKMLKKKRKFMRRTIHEMQKTRPNKMPDESICEMSVDVDVFMSYPALECLFDNHHPTLSKQWDLPVRVVKGGGTKPGCTVIMDDPLPPTNMTPPQQSTCIHEFFMGEIIRQPTSLPSYHLGAAAAAAAVGFADVITDWKKENSADEGDDDDGDNSSNDNDDDEASNDGINDNDLFSDCSMDITELEREILLNASEDNITKNNFSDNFVKINENNDLEVDGDRKGLISTIHFENDEQLSDLLSSANGIANEASEEEDDDEKLVIVTDNINSPTTSSRHVNDHVDSPSALVDGHSIDDDEIKKEQLIVGEEGNVTANQPLSTLPLSPIQSFDGNSDERDVDDVANHQKNVFEKQQEEEEEEVMAAPNKRRSNRLAMKQKSVERGTSEVGNNDRKRKRSREEDNNVEACCNDSETSSLITKSFKASSPEPPTTSLPLPKLSSSKTSSSLSPVSLSPSSSSLLLTSSPPTSLSLSILPPSSCSSSQIPAAANPHTPLRLSSSFSDVAPNERRQTSNHPSAADSRFENSNDVTNNGSNLFPNTKIENFAHNASCTFASNQNIASNLPQQSHIDNQQFLEQLPQPIQSFLQLSQHQPKHQLQNLQLSQQNQLQHSLQHQQQQHQQHNELQKMFQDHLLDTKLTVGSDNVAYSYWNVNGCKVLIKHRYMANNYLSDSMTEVHVKMEYQSHHGREQMTISEMGRIWLALFTKPRIQNVLLARVDACSSKLLEIEKFSLNDINVNFNKSLNQLSAILEKCKGLNPGQYILSHNASTNIIKIKKNVLTQEGTYNLHKAYHDTQHCNTMKPQDVVDKHWLSVTANVQSCKQSNKIPCTFDIREKTKPNMKKKKKSQRKTSRR